MNKITVKSIYAKEYYNKDFEYYFDFELMKQTNNVEENKNKVYRVRFNEKSNELEYNEIGQSYGWESYQQDSLLVKEAYDYWLIEQHLLK